MVRKKKSCWNLAKSEDCVIIETLFVASQLEYLILMAIYCERKLMILAILKPRV